MAATALSSDFREMLVALGEILAEVDDVAANNGGCVLSPSLRNMVLVGELRNLSRTADLAANMIEQAA